MQILLQFHQCDSQIAERGCFTRAIAAYPFSDGIALKRRSMVKNLLPILDSGLLAAGLSAEGKH
ncbi:hypothetical protein [Trichocoleus sp. FACHB-262]|uniref:hypothetical protein n=1 Tax=Trichocoleus sp. FACHB-262 TaxID=2692869 RepID=UPI0016895E2A|nr:hypothetical protein [Trichocoleus sp. FACHB-262]MBD2124731.1 hypothetical protein [Trichocoleus sp. FACHB-262]